MIRSSHTFFIFSTFVEDDVFAPLDVVLVAGDAGFDGIDVTGDDPFAVRSRAAKASSEDPASSSEALELGGHSLLLRAPVAAAPSLWSSDACKMSGACVRDSRWLETLDKVRDAAGPIESKSPKNDGAEGARSMSLLIPPIVVIPGQRSILRIGER